LTEAEAKALVMLQCDYASDPVLTEAEVLAIVQRTARYGVWAASTAYVRGQKYAPGNGWIFQISTAGTTGATIPPLTSWPAPLSYPPRGFPVTLTDGTAVWSAYTLDPGERYDTDSATADCWRLKASRAAGRYTFSADGQSFNRSDLHKHCLTMARQWAGVQIA
jgi:hypothetical protein